MEGNHYFNRELSLLEFHKRVLTLASDKNLPLMERLRFLSISATNMDEFFEVRVGGLIEVIERGAGGISAQSDGLSAVETKELISKEAHAFVDNQYSILNDDIIPALADQGISILRRENWTDEQTAYLFEYFTTDVLPLLSPVGLDPAHPFPRILNKSLNFIVHLSGKDAFGRNSGQAIVQVPRSLSNLIELPEELCVDCRHFVMMSSIIHRFMDEIFTGMKVVGCYQFRITRNTDIFLDEEETDDLLRALEGELAYRQYGDEVRLEVASNMPEDLIEYLLSRSDLNTTDLYKVDGPVNLNRLADLFSFIINHEFYFPPFIQNTPKVFKRSDSYFDVLKKQDTLLFHPYDSFNSVVDLLRQAAKDPQVLAIKQTLYRTGAESPVVDALVQAARAGKEVTVIVELRARFDEHDNVILASRLQRYGIHVIYGIVGYKTHAKMLLIARKESRHIQYYVHLGTGNYHHKTTTVYTDYGLLTSDQQLGKDVYKIFLQLSSMGKVSKMQSLLHAPFTLHKSMLKKIQHEIENAENGLPARIILKMNSLYEDQLVNELYKASQAGVKIDLIIRGICQLKPGVEGLSENIKVHSIVGRFLEHSRVFYFQNNEDSELFLASADWMSRNMFHRVETCFPVRSKKLQDRVIEDLELYLLDNQNSWRLESSGEYIKNAPLEGEEIVDSQQILLDKWTNTTK